MKMFDPERPQINGQPAYGNPALAVLPRLQMMPKSHGLTEVSAMLSVGGFTFSWFSNYTDTSMIPNLLSRYHSDPESFLQSFFDYKIPQEKEKEEKIERLNFKPKTVLAVPKSTKTFSLSDL